ncbi:MAG: hypothetical protein K9G59_16220 [Caulobacter sp.]|nr:hypothetical protein [Caulobacter sp.]
MRLATTAAILLTLGLGACATTTPSPLSGDSDFSILTGGRVSGPELAARIRKASTFPLGSRDNPVRVNMPAGQRAYLDRLRCSNGERPTYGRVGNFGAGVFGSIIDGYRVVCPNGGLPAESLIYMDMYHADHYETAAPAGFTITGRAAQP